MTEELRKALEALKDHKMTEAEMNAQRISFAFGNAPRGEKGTKEDVRRAAMAQLAVA